ncbi:hypothetical protein N7475_008390 [Penicillium sp. IBT 31633x]|nr:hypothetical protein N7475_008390 [Penicillium sp. IBT 31633x]
MPISTTSSNLCREPSIWWWSAPLQQLLPFQQCASFLESLAIYIHLGDYIYEYENGVIGQHERAHSPEQVLPNCYISVSPAH